jgi:cytochrome c oxidase cbb3-type subunit I/II
MSLLQSEYCSTITKKVTHPQTAKPLNMHIEKFSYDNKIVRNFAYATVIWSIVGMLVGLWVALLMVFPEWNFGGIPVGSKETIGLTFGRLRPLHTNAVILPL